MAALFLYTHLITAPTTSGISETEPVYVVYFCTLVLTYTSFKANAFFKVISAVEVVERGLSRARMWEFKQQYYCDVFSEMLSVLQLQFPQHECILFAVQHSSQFIRDVQHVCIICNAFFPSLVIKKYFCS